MAHAASAIEVEGQAILAGLLLAFQLGKGKFIIETECAAASETLSYGSRKVGAGSGLGYFMCHCKNPSCP